MARFPRTLGEALASQAEAGRSTRTEVMSVEPLAPIGVDHLDAELTDNLNTLHEDLGLLANTMADMEISQGDNTLELSRLNDDLTQLDSDLTQLDADLTANKLAVDADMLQLGEDLDDLNTELAALPGAIEQAINDSNALPITSDRFTPNSLSVWPFMSNAIPQGAIPAGSLAPNSVFTDDIADFSLVARKFNDGRHRLY